MKLQTYFRIFLLLSAMPALDTKADVDLAKLEKCNVVWDTPGKTSLDSMPLGNGDIGLNVWVEKGGDLLFYVSKTDAWTDNVRQLVKVGRIRLMLTPNPFEDGAPFKQSLSLKDGAVIIDAGQTGRRRVVAGMGGRQSARGSRVRHGR